MLSSVNAVISTNERIEFIAGHMTYNPAYTYILKTTTTYFLQWKILITKVTTSSKILFLKFGYICIFIWNYL